MCACVSAVLKLEREEPDSVSLKCEDHTSLFSHTLERPSKEKESDAADSENQLQATFMAVWLVCACACVRECVCVL